MNKKLIAAAVAAVMAAPVVSAADTTLYGIAHMDIRSTDAGNNNDAYSVNSNSSRIGVKGSEDLGDGLKAIFQFEMTYTGTDGASGGTGAAIGSARNSFVGLSGGFGTFLVGTHDTPAKIALNSAKLSTVSDSLLDFEASGFTEFRTANAIAYVSPNFSGFTVAAAVLPGEETATAGNTAPLANGLADAYSLGAMYAGGGLKAGVGYEVMDGDIDAIGGAADQEMWQAAASYTFGDFFVGGAYENMDDAGGVAGAERETYGLTARATLSNNYVFANYTNDEHKTAAGVSTLENDTFGIGVGHKFSKRTQVYAMYENIDNGLTGGQDTDAFSLGMVHNF